MRFTIVRRPCCLSFLLYSSSFPIFTFVYFIFIVFDYAVRIRMEYKCTYLHRTIVWYATCDMWWQTLINIYSPHMYCTMPRDAMWLTMRFNIRYLKKEKKAPHKTPIENGMKGKRTDKKYVRSRRTIITQCCKLRMTQPLEYANYFTILEIFFILFSFVVWY